MKDGDRIAPCSVYVHNSGYRLPQLMADAAPKMRKGDLGYAVARLIGSLHEEDPAAVLSLGVLSPPPDLEPDTLKEYSHGDAGVAVWDCTTGEIEWFEGYFANYDDYDDIDEPPSKLELNPR